MGIFEGIGSLVGSFLQKDAQDEANAMSRDLALQNFAMQERFAKEGIRWKVEDAKAAGIHPLYALGASTPSFSPVSANFTTADGLAKAGQDIGAAIDKTRTAEEKMSAFATTMQKLSLEKAGLENDLLRSEIASKTARLRQTSSPPMPVSGDAYLIPGQGNSPLIKNRPLEVTPSPMQSPSTEGGAISDVGYARTKTGWAPVPSKDVKERIEDQIIPETMWAIRNNLMPSAGMNLSPPPFKAPAGQQWFFDVLRQEYQLKPADTPWYKRGFDVRIDK